LTCTRAENTSGILTARGAGDWARDAKLTPNKNEGFVVPTQVTHQLLAKVDTRTSVDLTDGLINFEISPSWQYRSG
jgi:hypothetical protein